MARLTLKKRFDFYKSNEEETVINVTGYTQFTTCGSNPHKRKYYLSGEAVEKLASYEDAEEKGLFFKLPCKPGDSVFIVITKTGEIKEHKVSKIILGKTYDQIVFVGGKCFTIWGKDWNEHLCKYVHFTKEAAEQELKQIQEGTNNE